MIPCSKLEEILRVYLGHPGDAFDEAALAAFITSKSFDVYKEERSEKAVLLHAAVLVIEQRLREGEGPVTLSGDGYEKKCFVHGGEDEYGADYYTEAAHLIDALIAYAEATN